MLGVKREIAMQPIDPSRNEQRGRAGDRIGNVLYRVEKMLCEHVGHNDRRRDAQRHQRRPHLRELDLSVAAQNGRASVIALDQDEDSLQQVAQDYSRYGVETREASVRSIVANRTRIPECDLAYTAGLYDYLPDAAATRLTTQIFQALRPGGTLLIANFLQDIIDAGYMESVMDWHVIYRSDEDIRRLIDQISVSDVTRVDQFHDPFDNVTFLQMTKRR